MRGEEGKQDWGGEVELGLSELLPDAAPASSPVPTALAEALRLEGLPCSSSSGASKALWGWGLGTKPSEGGWGGLGTKPSEQVGWGSTFSQASQ